jgi:hypothetical protein
MLRAMHLRQGRCTSPSSGPLRCSEVWPLTPNCRYGMSKKSSSPQIGSPAPARWPGDSPTCRPGSAQRPATPSRPGLHLRYREPAWGKNFHPARSAKVAPAAPLRRLSVRLWAAGVGADDFSHFAGLGFASTHEDEPASKTRSSHVSVQSCTGSLWASSNPESNDCVTSCG